MYRAATSSSIKRHIKFAGIALDNIPLGSYVIPKSHETKMTALPNGVKIAAEPRTYANIKTHENNADPACAVGLFVDCGSVCETPEIRGASHMLQRMAFKGTKIRCHFRHIRQIDVNASREYMGYKVGALKTSLERMVESLVDCVRNPNFLDYELQEELDLAKLDLGRLYNNPQVFLLELLHAAGYHGPLANPLFAPEASLKKLDGPTLQKFIAENYTAPRMVLTSSGLEHEELLSVAEPFLSDLPSVPLLDKPKSIYFGGDYKYVHQGESESNDMLQGVEQSAHVALAFEVPGGWQNEKGALVLTVLQKLMGGGSSSSVEGIDSRLYLRVLKEYQQIQSFSAFNSLYNNMGLFGIYASISPDFVPKAVDIAAKELIAIASPGQVSQIQLERAKKSARSEFLKNLESRMNVSEDIGRHILTYGERKPVEPFLDALDEITLNDITNLAQKIISTPLTMASYGDVSKVPSYESVDSKFHAK